MLHNNQCSYAELEWDKIVSALGHYTFSDLGEQAMLQLKPQEDVQHIEYLLRINSECRDAIEIGVRFPISGLTDCSNDLKSLSIEGSLLLIDGINRITGSLEIAQRVAKAFKDRSETFPELCKLINQVCVHQKIIKEIRSCIEDNGEILDSASPELKKIRSAIRRLKNTLKKRVEAIVKQSSRKGLLQEAHYTVRNGRCVLPVKDSHQRQIDGITHDVSSTGATVFIEPKDIVERSNEISRYIAQEEEEIRKILRKCSDLLRPTVTDISHNQEILTKLDTHYACGMLSKRLGASAPAVSSGRGLVLRTARHPVLVLQSESPEKVIPLNVSLGETFNTLIVSGPNAGGKTVTLKTVGLLSLMVQSGLPVPASPDSCFPVFKRVVADIGDQQSIDENLSTFSARLIHLNSIFETLSENDLILLDEIGAGTDPQEGVHLAMALLNHITKSGALAIATTHHGGLKRFARETDGVENASLSFDKKSLQPTFELTVGIPGSSYALELAKRIGLPESVIEETERRLGDKQVRVEDFIQELEESIAVYKKKNSEMQGRQEKLDALIEEYSGKLKQFDKKHRNSLDEALRESEEQMDDFNRRFENLVRKLKEEEASADSVANVKHEIREEREKIAKRKKSLSQKPTDKTSQSLILEIGSTVKLAGHDQVGVIIAENLKKKKATVQINSVKMEVNKEQLVPASSKSKRKVTDSVPLISVKSEIDLRGLELEETIATVDMYLTDAATSGHKTVRIIHGKGTGRLRKRIGEFLKHDKRINEYRLGEWGEGDTGVTIATIK